MKTIIIVTSLIIPFCLRADCPGISPCIEVKYSENQQLFSPQVQNKSYQSKEHLEQKAKKLIDYAKSFIGTPYKWGGNDEDGIDCSAFIKKVFSFKGLVLPRTSTQQYHSETLYQISVYSLRPLDLLFFTRPNGQKINHVAMYIGNGRMIHSSRTEAGVEITNINFSDFWSKRFFAAKRPILTTEAR